MSQQRPPHGYRETRLARRAKAVSKISAGAMIPTMILVGLVGGYFLGAWIQGRIGGEPWVAVSGVVLGGVASVRKIIQMLRVDQRNLDDD